MGWREFLTDLTPLLGLPQDARVVACDCEASGLYPDDGARVSVVSVAWNGGFAAFPFDQGSRDKTPTNQLGLFEQEDPNLGEEEWRELLRWLAARQLVFHNGMYDVLMMGAGTRHWSGIDLLPQFVWCTMLASRVLDPLEPAGLDACARRSGMGGKVTKDLTVALKRNPKGMKKRYDLVPWNDMEEYATVDAELTLAVYLDQWGRATPTELRQIELEFGLMRVLTQMERRGVGFDVARSREAAQILTDRANDLAKTLPFVETPAGAKGYFFKELALPPDRVTKKRGDPCLDEEQVKVWIEQGVPHAQAYADLNKIRRTVSMHYAGYADKTGPDGRLRTRFRQGGARSDRMSVERVNLQAIPKKDKNVVGVPGIRELLQPRPGKELWSVDLSQAELRVASKYAGCTKMLQMLLEGVDFHGYTTTSVIGSVPTDDDWLIKRDIGKRLSFSAIFGIGGESFQALLSKAAGIRLSLAECELMIRKWRREYPEYGKVKAQAAKYVERNGYVRQLPNTQHEYKSWFGPRDFPHTGWSRIVQGSLAGAMKMWLVAVEAAYPGLPVLTVHDSIYLEGPSGDVEEAANGTAAIAAELFTKLFSVPMSAEPHRDA